MSVERSPVVRFASAWSSSTDHSLVVWEAYPGATNDIDRLAAESGGWVCEQHPHLEWPHDECAGPGMLAESVSEAAS